MKWDLWFRVYGGDCYRVGLYDRAAASRGALKAAEAVDRIPGCCLASSLAGDA